MVATKPLSECWVIWDSSYVHSPLVQLSSVRCGRLGALWHLWCEQRSTSTLFAIGAVVRLSWQECWDMCQSGAVCDSCLHFVAAAVEK